MTLGLRILLVAVAGFLIAKAHTSVPLLALICLTPLLVALQTPDKDATAQTPKGPSLKHAIGLGGLAYGLAGAHVWGIGQYGWTVYMAAVCYLAAGGALFGALAWPFLTARRRWVRVAGIAGAWVMADFTRTLTAWSYPMLLGPCLGDYPILSQIAAIAGPWGMDAFVVTLSALLAEAFEARIVKQHPWLPRARPLVWLSTAAMLLSAVLVFGALRLASAGPSGVAVWNPEHPEPAPTDPLTFALTQGAVPTWFYRRAIHVDRLQTAIEANYLGLLDAALAERPWGRAPDWIVLPEASFNLPLRRTTEGLSRIDGLLDRRLPPHTTLLLGSTTELSTLDPEHPSATRENTAMAIVGDAEGRPTLADSVTKRRLVPIAEATFRPGDSWRPLPTTAAHAGILICFESLYPAIATTLTRSGADVLVVITNDAGMRWSLAPRVHARLGRLRAIEHGASLLHAGQAGITFATDPYGRSTWEMGLFERGLLTGAVTRKRVWTPYGAIGEAWVALFAALWALAFFLKKYKRM